MCHSCGRMSYHWCFALRSGTLLGDGVSMFSRVFAVLGDGELHGNWLIRCDRDHAFMFRMRYRYCHVSLAQTASSWVTVDLNYTHPRSPNIYVNNHASMLRLDLLRANLISSFYILQKKNNYWYIFQLKRHYFGIKLLYIFGRSCRRKKNTSLVDQSNVASVI